MAIKQLRPVPQLYCDSIVCQVCIAKAKPFAVCTIVSFSCYFTKKVATDCCLVQFHQHSAGVFAFDWFNINGSQSTPRSSSFAWFPIGSAVSVKVVAVSPVTVKVYLS